MYPRLSQGEWVSPLAYSQHKLDSAVGGGALDQWKTYTNHGFFFQKIQKVFIQLWQWLSQIHHYWIITRYKIRSSVIFLIEKITSIWSNPETVKKLRTGNLLVEVESKKHAENLLKMEKFHNLKCRAYPHAKLNTSKGVVRSKELSLATPEEIETTFKKQGIKEYRNDETIQTHTYILTFEKPSIPKEIRIGYTIERVEQYIPAPLQCFKCQKFGHHKEICRGRQVCGKCGERDPDQTENECKSIKCANCHEEDPAFSSCAIYKKEKEIMFIKHTKNIPFPEVRKIVESYMGTKTYANVAQKVNQPPQDSTSIDKYQNQSKNW